MKNANNLILGGILILLGGALLGMVNHWFTFDVSMRQIAKFWPLLIILAGLAVMMDSKRSVMNSTSVLLVALAIPFGIYNCTSSTFSKVEEKWSDGNIEFEANISEDDEPASNDSLNHSNYIIEKSDAIKRAELIIEGGAAQFLLKPAVSGQLFSADTKNGGKNSNYSVREETSGDNQKVTFKMKGKKNIKWNDKDHDRKITFHLNEEPIWKIKMGIGAGDVQYDLSSFKVDEIALETGASNINLKMGSLVDDAEVKIESGVANIEIAIPEAVGCEIKMDGALNAKDFEGFIKVKSGLYQTPGYDSASKKIRIDMDSGMSNFVVKRY